MKSALTFLTGLGVIVCLAGCDKPEASTDHASPGIGPATTSTNASSSAHAATAPSSANAVAMVTLSPASGSTVRGTVTFYQEDGKMRVEAAITGLKPGPHGFHIHEKGDCSAPDASSAGGHFNPTSMPHAGPGEHQRHVGDFGNLEADQDGNAKYSQSFADLKIDGDTSIIGRAVIVHEKADDLKTQPSGDAGGRVACGVIEKK